MSERAHILLVDDNAEFRQSAAWWLEGLGYEVSAYEAPDACLAALEAQTEVEANVEPRARPASLLLLDVRMPQMSGLQLMDAVRARGVGLPVIFMTAHGDVPLAVEAMRKGAVTFLEKPFQEQALEQALQQALEQAAAAQPPPPPAEPAPQEDPEYLRRLALLTPREQQVLDHVVTGLPNKIIAYRLGVSPKTVELHRSRVMAKMQAGSFTQLLRMAMTRSAQEG